MTATPDSTMPESRLDALAVYLKPRVLIVLFLGFSSGLPLALSGSTLAVWLTERGVDLKEARIVADDREAISSALTALRLAHDYVFTSGGIGPTHDDITAEAIAAACGLEGVEFDASRPEGALSRAVDVSRLVALGFAPGVDLDEGIRRTLDVYRGGRA